MLKLDNTFLASLGLGALSAEEKEAFLSYLYDELQIRIGMELSEDLSDAQLEELEKLIDGDNQAAAAEWLQNHCPDYEGVAQRHIEQLKQEITAGKEQLLTEE